MATSAEAADSAATNSTIKRAIQLEFKNLYKNLNAYEIIPSLFSENIITESQYQQLEKIGDHRGAFAQAKKLLRYLLDKKNKKLQDFINILKEEQPEIYEELNKAIERVSNGEIGGLREHLVKVYTDKKFTEITALSGENFILRLKDKKQIMQLDFTAEKIITDPKKTQHLQDCHLEARYEEENCENIEDIIKTMQSNPNLRILICTANPGTGKTTLMHLLTTNWMKQTETLKGFEGLFVLKIRDINVKAPLIEILGKNGLGYLDDKMLSIFNVNCSHTAKMIFLIDGLDEKDIPNDSELYKLITGSLYPEIKIVITARPVTSILSALKNPSFKVKIHGTTKKEVERYLKKQVDKKVDLKALMSRFEEKMTKFSLLQVPLYLTMTVFLLNDYWSQYFTFKNFKVPETTTQLMNYFFLFLIRKWLERGGRKDETEEIKLVTNPIDETSNVPADLKQQLLAFGHMSYELLAEKRYDFTEEDLKKYLTSIKQVRASGLFCVSAEHKHQIMYFCRHKQFQEYMSALFLSHYKLNYTPFSKLIDSKVNTRQKKCTPLKDVFGDIYPSIPFLFGLEPKLAFELLEKLKPRLCISEYMGCINLDFEAQVCVESANKDVCALMRNILLEKKDTLKHYVYNYSAPLATLFTFLECFTKEQMAKLLKLFHFEVTEKKPCGNWLIQRVGHKKPSQIEISNLHSALFVILYQFQFHGIKFLQVHTSYIPHITDIGLMQKLFPQLETLHLHIANSSENVDLEGIFGKSSDVKCKNRLRVVSLRYAHYFRSPEGSVRCLLEQTNLESLTLCHIDILTNLPETSHINWPNLKTLEICLFQMTDENKCTFYNRMDSILQKTPELCELRFGFKYIETAVMPDFDVIEKFLQRAKCLHNLTTLCLYNAMKPGDIKRFLSCLDELPRVTKLGLCLENMAWTVQEISKALSSLHHIKQFQIMYKKGDQGKSATLLDQFKKTLILI